MIHATQPDRRRFQQWEAFGESTSFDRVVNEYLTDFVSASNFLIPAAVALNQALKENIFAIVACTQTNVPLGIVGAPGSSKSLSMHIVRDNLQGPLNSPKPFCKQFSKLDLFFYQCSRYSTSKVKALSLDISASCFCSAMFVQHSNCNRQSHMV